MRGSACRGMRKAGCQVKQISGTDSSRGDATTRVTCGHSDVASNLESRDFGRVRNISPVE